jgi:hypothetical protein
MMPVAEMELFNPFLMPQYIRPYLKGIHWHGLSGSLYRSCVKYHLQEGVIDR